MYTLGCGRKCSAWIHWLHYPVCEWLPNTHTQSKDVCLNVLLAKRAVTQLSWEKSTLWKFHCGHLRGVDSISFLTIRMFALQRLVYNFIVCGH